MTPGLVIAAPRSRSGKTTITLGLLRAFARQGVRVQPFKAGPDYIDTAFQSRASGRTALNLDSWSMPEPLLDRIAAYADDADLALAEGAMGLFDGAPAMGESGTGASADIAARRGWPVLLVLDVSGQSQSAAAVADGFRRMRPDVTIAGVILNKVASDRHGRLVRDALERIAMPVLGALPRSASLTLPERHLGLVQASEHPDIDGAIDRIADSVAAHVDLPAVRAIAASARNPARNAPPLAPPGQRIALASDAAFAFCYGHLATLWHAAGAQILPFSPLADEAPAADADIVWLPGGYPELHAGKLAAAGHFLEGLRHHARDRAIHGECGGYMVLGEAIVDANGCAHAMAGLLGLVTSFAARRLHLGYRSARLLAPVGNYPAGMRLRGHEFHYSTIVAQPDPPLADIHDAEGRRLDQSGSRRGRVTGSYFHLVAPATGRHGEAAA
ncbi:cobyrinate a,c-diamide synthase [Flavisphingomonas formosensis]|uniref:cobyrinate a,c-diamide synthase n=1 Tax=Flavisphingomonas formosensis TaxID=861534 RepID=UPI0012FC1E9A|nr:cobyrinate a,c-diamide synthase [Sphingomonas formosensis]